MNLESNELLNELETTIQLLEAEIPANPSAPKNESIEKGLQNSLSDYFQNVDNALDWNALEQLFYRNSR